MSTERFVQTLFASMGSWFSSLPAPAAKEQQAPAVQADAEVDHV